MHVVFKRTVVDTTAPILNRFPFFGQPLDAIDFISSFQLMSELLRKIDFRFFGPKEYLPISDFIVSCLNENSLKWRLLNNVLCLNG